MSCLKQKDRNRTVGHQQRELVGQGHWGHCQGSHGDPIQSGQSLMRNSSSTSSMHPRLPGQGRGAGWGAPAALGSSSVASPSSVPSTDAVGVGLAILKQAGREQFLTASGWRSL